MVQCRRGNAALSVLATLLLLLIQPGHQAIAVRVSAPSSRRPARALRGSSGEASSSGRPDSASTSERQEHAPVPRCMGTMCVESAALAPPEWYQRAREALPLPPSAAPRVGAVPEEEADWPIAIGWKLHSSPAPDLDHSIFDLTKIATDSAAASGGGAGGLTWMGSDVAASIKLQGERYVWWFGDTFLGQFSPMEGRRYDISYFPRQSIALVDLTVAPQWDGSRKVAVQSVSFQWASCSRSADATTNGTTLNGDGTAHQPGTTHFVNDGLVQNYFRYPQADFGPVQCTTAAANQELQWLWVLGGMRPTHTDGSAGPLLLQAIHVVMSDDIVHYNIPASVVIAVQNPEDEPQTWQYKVADIPAGGRDLYMWGAAVVDVWGWMYLLGVVKKDGDFYSDQVLARVPTNSYELLDFSGMEVWSTPVSFNESAPAALPGWHPATAAPLLEWAPLVKAEAATELSLSFHAGMSRWIMLSVPLYSPHLLIWTAPTITGPWERSVAYSFPEPFCDISQYRIYAAKLHPELATHDDELVVSYVLGTGLNVTASAFYQPGPPWYYTPRFLRLRLTPPQ